MKKISLFLFSVLVFGFCHPSGAAWFEGRPNSFAPLVKKVKSAVVNISTTKKVKHQPARMPRSPFGEMDPFEEFRKFFEDQIPREEEQHSLGTGFIINKGGDILTNNHVVGDADEILVKLFDGRKFKASVVGRDEKTDIAVIKIKSKEDLPYATLGNSDLMESGDWVVAVGNPFGFEQTVTVGVVSAKGRVIGDSRAPFAKFIQTDASINPGNSGGPLFNVDGEVIGINTMIYGMGTGIGFAIPINLAKEEVPQLISKGSITRGWLGVQIQQMTPELAESYGLKQEEGALIGSIFPGSPAEQAGLKRGDIVIAYDGKKVEEPFDLSAYVASTTVGKTIKLTVLRQGKQIMIDAKVGKREEEAKETKPQTPVEKVEANALGLSVRSPTAEESKRLNLPDANHGVIIDQVQPNSSAETHDVREGDLLLEVNGASINNVADYQKEVQKLKKGDLVRLLIGRGNVTIYVAFRI